MDLDTFIIVVFWWIDEAIPRVTGGCRLRERGPAPFLADSEVVTMEAIGEYLGLVQDSALFAYFRQHCSHFFPALSQVHRTTFVRQAANLWRLKERLWQDVLSRVPHDEQFAIIESFSVPVCQFARAHRCRRFRAEAAFGKDTLVRQTFYGLRVHVRLEWPGLITRFGIAAANVHELSALSTLAEATRGILVGDRNYWSPAVAAEWQQHGVDLLAPHRTAKRGSHPRWSARLSRVCYRIDTVFGQLVDRCSIDGCGHETCGICPVVCCAKCWCIPWPFSSMLTWATHPCNWRGWWPPEYLHFGLIRRKRLWPILADCHHQGNIGCRLTNFSPLSQTNYIMAAFWMVC